ncbi:adenylyl-sulfate kinase [Paenibacillus sp. GCM10027627]|uniref:adenylyl-sulfate kinase n=1 Tax=unclassified Paenibacillus TaxID=185978 RepID=UPI00363EB8BB
MRQGKTIWLTGLPSSGKTTTARALTEAFRAKGHAVECLDGDELRQALGRELGFSREDRMENVRRAVYICRMLNRNGITAVVAMISPYAEMREYARVQLDYFTEVYVECPLEECIRRDVKGLYARAIAGEIPSFTGVSDRYEPPAHPDIVVRTDLSSVEGNVIRILESVAD